MDTKEERGQKRTKWPHTALLDALKRSSHTALKLLTYPFRWKLLEDAKTEVKRKKETKERREGMKKKGSTTTEERGPG